MANYKFEGWLACGPEAAEGKLEWGVFEPKVWQEDDVDIQVTHCGVCGTDVHIIRADWGKPLYPCCVGHEIVGRAVCVGEKVKDIRVGDRVGVGPQAWSCLQHNCDQCASGREPYCPQSVTTYASVYPNGGGNSYGGYSNYNRTNSNFVFKIPEPLASEDAAPMLCAGITVYSPLRRYGCGPGKKIGIIGIGGLGHFGILFSKAMEADEVVAISRTRSKQSDALALGADKYIATAEDSEWACKNARSLDIIIATSLNSDMPVDQYVKMLKVGGTLVVLSAPPGGQFPPLNALNLLYNGANIAGSLGGSRAEIREMLDLAAQKQIRPWIQTIPMKDANRALLDLEAGKPRYRFVLVNTDH